MAAATVNKIFQTEKIQTAWNSGEIAPMYKRRETNKTAQILGG